ncbi:hypothetical protein [Rothia sp. P5766]|uniref:hypothetical protein n=1 Tax=Rothia sp. P5766 TaxID=3402656 RepID=UPI003AE739AC
MSSGYVYRDPKRAGGALAAQAPAPAPAPAGRRVPNPAAVAQALRAKDARIKELESQLNDYAENYDTLAGINADLTKALAEAKDLTEKAEEETRALKVEAEQTSITKVLEEELTAERAKNAELTAKTKELQAQLTRSRRKVQDARKTAQEHAGAAVTISANGVELHGAYQRAPIEQITGTLNQAFELFVRSASDRHIADARR